MIFGSDKELIPQAVAGDDNLYVDRNGVLALLAPTTTTPGDPRLLALNGDGQTALIDTGQPLDAADTNGGADIYKVPGPRPAARPVSAHHHDHLTPDR